MITLLTFIFGIMVVLSGIRLPGLISHRYLEEELIQKDLATAQKTHFFNTFFYERLLQKTADKK